MVYVPESHSVVSWMLLDVVPILHTLSILLEDATQSVDHQNFDDVIELERLGLGNFEGMKVSSWEERSCYITC